MSRLTSLIQYVIALIIVLFFANFGHDPSFLGALKGSYTLLSDTIRGIDIKANYYVVYPPAIWYTTRLILLATVLGSFGGLLLSIVRMRIRNQLTSGVLNSLIVVLESVPDDMYVIVTVIASLFLFEHVGIIIPVFNNTYNPTFSDTIIPAIALALPSGFYMQRVMTLHLRDELASQYVVTAVSKGMSRQRAFLKHVLPNIYPTFLRNVPVVAGIVISSSIFAEFFFGYQGMLYKLLQGSGWSQTSGLKIPGYMLGGYIPEYQPGTIWLIGALIVTLWYIFHFLGISLSRFNRLSGIVKNPTGFRSRIKWNLVIVGSVMVFLVLLVGTFPGLITPYSANHVDYGNIAAGQAWPLLPSIKHPFGTDDFGRDMLALVVHGTCATIGVTTAITAIGLIGSIFIATVTYAIQSRYIAKALNFIGTLMISLPVLYVGFLVLFPRNSSLEKIMSETPQDIHHQVWTFVLAIGILEIGRGSYSFHQAIEGWRQFNFMDGIQSVGRKRVTVLFTHLRSWFGQFTIEYVFIEFVRVLSIMVQLSALHIFLANKYGPVPFTLSIISQVHGVIPAYNTWFGLIGQISNQYTFISYVWMLYAPILFLLTLMIGANLVGRGLRGQEKS